VYVTAHSPVWQLFAKPNSTLLRPVKLATKSRLMSNDPNFKSQPLSILEKVVFGVSILLAVVVFSTAGSVLLEVFLND
jgi:hypothetical protein